MICVWIGARIFDGYKQRHKIENMFAKIKDRRRIAMRYV
jgi:transposase